MAAVLIRILGRTRKGEKENLKKRIHELQAELKALRKKEE